MSDPSASVSRLRSENIIREIVYGGDPLPLPRPLGAGLGVQISPPPPQPGAGIQSIATPALRTDVIRAQLRATTPPRAAYSPGSPGPATYVSTPPAYEVGGAYSATQPVQAAAVGGWRNGRYKYYIGAAAGVAALGTLAYNLLADERPQRVRIDASGTGEAEASTVEVFPSSTTTPEAMSSTTSPEISSTGMQSTAGEMAISTGDAKRSSPAPNPVDIVSPELKRLAIGVGIYLTPQVVQGLWEEYIKAYPNSGLLGFKEYLEKLFKLREVWDPLQPLACGIFQGAGSYALHQTTLSQKELGTSVILSAFSSGITNYAFGSFLLGGTYRPLVSALLEGAAESLVGNDKPLYHALIHMGADWSARQIFPIKIEEIAQ